MLDVNQFSNHVVIPVLKKMEMYSPSAVNLIIGTALQESRLVYIKQLSGPALGVMQVEPSTLRDLYENYLSYRKHLKSKLDSFVHWNESYERNWPYLEMHLTGNLFYSVAVARTIYWRDKEPMPETLEGQAAYWKRIYNTLEGKGTEEQYIKAWHRDGLVFERETE